MQTLNPHANPESHQVTKHPKEVAGMKVDAILRGGIRKFTDEVRVLTRVMWGEGSARQKEDSMDRVTPPE